MKSPPVNSPGARGSFARALLEPGLIGIAFGRIYLRVGLQRDSVHTARQEGRIESLQLEPMLG